MSARTVYFGIALAAFLAATLVSLIYFLLRLRRAGKEDWPAILVRLSNVDRATIAAIATRQSDWNLEPAEIIEQLGGLTGLQMLGANCDVLIELACHCQRWYPEALLVAEQLRRDAREIKWRLGRLEGAAHIGNLGPTFAEYAVHVAETYYLMTQHLLKLYEHGDLAYLVELQRVI